MNNVTNSMNLVEQISLGNPLERLFHPSLRGSESFSIEIFCQDSLIASIRSGNDMPPPGWRWYVTSMLKINLGPRPMSLQGWLQTREGYTRSYTVDIRFHVSNPGQFALLYLQQSDPLFLAQQEFVSTMQTAFLQNSHDNINHQHIQNVGMTTVSTATQQLCGIMIDKVFVRDLKLAPLIGQIAEIHNNTLLEEARLNGEIQILNRRNANQRSEDEAQQWHEIRIDRARHQAQRHDAIYNEFARGITASIRDDFERGLRPDQILLEHPELQSMDGFRIIGRSSNPLQLPDADQPQTHNDQEFQVQTHRKGPPTPDQQESQTIEGEFTFASGSLSDAFPIINTRPTNANQSSSLHTPSSPPTAHTSHADPTLIPLPALGLTVARLSDEEVAQMSDPGLTAKYILQEINTTLSPQHKKLVRGDYLISINDQDITDDRTLQQALQSLAPNQSPVIRIYRQGQLIDLCLEITH